MHKARPGDLIYDWNLLGWEKTKPLGRRVELDDETLRDGLQSPSARIPTLDQKKRLLHLMEDLRMHCVDLGFPCAGPKSREHVMELARETMLCKMKIIPNAAARTIESDIVPILDIAQKLGMTLEVDMFVGSSPIRQYAEGWTLDHLLEMTEKAVGFAVGRGMPVMYVTEDTSRAHPKAIKALFGCAIRAGATRICVCDTCGHSTPNGVRNLVGFVVEFVRKVNPAVKIDWHGHDDRGLALMNSIAALDAGADRIHGTGLGIGERAGNMSMDVFILNMKLMGWIDWDVTKLTDYCRAVSEATSVGIPDHYPLVGKYAFETATGVHAAAVIKALKKGDRWLADRMYSGVPAEEFGMEQKIRVGPMSGKSNCIYWLEKHHIRPTDELVQRLYHAAKAADRLLTDDELMAIVKNA